MAVGFASYEIARSGLTYNERGLDVTGHNISNINTKGYSRQQAVAQGSFYIKNNAKYGYGQVGTGVDIQQTRQIRHKFLDSMYRYENAKASYWGKRAETFSEIENIMGEPIGDGLQSLLNRFWNSWQELSKDPASLTTRALVRQLGESIVFELNSMGAQFDQMQLDLDSQFVDSIASLNDMCKQVAALNLKIKQIQVTGEAPNDFMDARNALFDEISALIDCEIYERDDGMYDIISNGAYLVYRDTAKEMITMQTPESGMFHKAFVVMNDANPPKLLEMKFGECKIKGILESRGEVINALDLNLENPANLLFDTTDPLNSTIETYVRFERGSISNGSPNTKTDIVIAIDVSDSSEEYMSRVKTNIDNYVDSLLKKGLDFNLKLVTYGATATTLGEYTNKNSDPPAADDLNNFIADVLANVSTDAGDANNSFADVVRLLTDMSDTDKFRTDANRYTVLFTKESIDGDEHASTIAEADAYVEALNKIGMSVSVVTETAVHYDGIVADPTAPFGWSRITGGTAGALIAYDEFTGGEMALRDFSVVMQDANDFVNRSVNDRISRIEESKQIIPDARKRLNALINIICRAVNELHRSGKTLETPPQDGEDFFVPINAKHPMALGNIQINPKFNEANGLNYIVSSQTGFIEDNVIALAIANLRNAAASISGLEGGVTFDDYYRGLVYSISTSAAESDQYQTSQTILASSLDQSRHSIMDVSMDEELSNMMKYKFGYDAAARVLNVIDDMISTIVNRMGIVGR